MSSSPVAIAAKKFHQRSSANPFGYSNNLSVCAATNPPLFPTLFPHLNYPSMELWPWRHCWARSPPSQVMIVPVKHTIMLGGPPGACTRPWIALPRCRTPVLLMPDGAAINLHRRAQFRWPPWPEPPPINAPRCPLVNIPIVYRSQLRSRRWLLLRVFLSHTSWLWWKTSNW